jgi:hypothetical protein
MEQGFGPVLSKSLVKLILHYRFHNWPADEVASFATVLERLTRDALGWTGNGHYDGFSVGYQELTLWFLVLDPKLAVETVLEVLGNHGYLHDAETQASLAIERGDAFVFAYPPERRGERFA